TDLKWGTSNPVMMRDPEFGMIRMRAFGTYAMKVSDPKAFFQTIVGTQGLTTTEDILGQLRSTILSKLSDAIASAKIAALDLAQNYDELAVVAKQVLAPEFASYGLDLAKFYVENISLPEEVEAAIDQRTKLGVLGDKMQQYTQLQAADSIKIAAANPGGIAGAGAGIGAGMAIGNAMSGAFNQASQPSQSTPPPPPLGGGASAPQAARWSIAIDGKTYGPYTDDALRAMVSSGQVAGSTQAWRPGASGWAPLESYSEFESHGGHMPPPPPPK
ncbi:MAG TPA: SPFH domain-containing protein, partial [Thermoanaerobaculia bacterium]